MNFFDTFERYHMRFLYETSYMNIYSSDFHGYWEIYQKYINYLINKDKDKVDDLVDQSVKIDYFELMNHLYKSMRNMIKLLLKNNDRIFFKYIRTNFKQSINYPQIYKNRRFICKTEIYKIYNVDDPLNIVHYDLDIAFDNHNEALIQYIIYTFIDSVHVPFISKTLYSIQEIHNSLHIGVLMENAKGFELSSILSTKLTSSRILNILIKIIDVIESLQTKLNFIHGDLKPSNIIVDFIEPTNDICNIKIIDFGLSYIYFKENHVMTTALLNLELDKNINQTGDYQFDYIHYLNSEHKYSGDLMYLFLCIMFSLNRLNPLYQMFERYLFDVNPPKQSTGVADIFDSVDYVNPLCGVTNIINSVDYVNSVKVNRIINGLKYEYSEFVMSKDTNIFKLYFPDMNIDEFYGRFTPSNLRRTLEYIQMLSSS